jgi:hypothetical protein
MPDLPMGSHREPMNPDADLSPPGAAELIAAAWTLVCGVAALRIGTWFSRWEGRRRRRLLCRPLSAGVLAHVYYVAEAGTDR